MSTLYNNINKSSTTKEQLYKNLLEFLVGNFSCSIPLPCLKFIPTMILALIEHESVIFSDLADFIAPTLNIANESAERNISKFLKNPNYDFDSLYHNFINLSYGQFFKITKIDKFHYQLKTLLKTY